MCPIPGIVTFLFVPLGKTYDDLQNVLQDESKTYFREGHRHNLEKTIKEKFPQYANKVVAVAGYRGHMQFPELPMTGSIYLAVYRTYKTHISQKNNYRFTDAEKQKIKEDVKSVTLTEKEMEMLNKLSQYFSGKDAVVKTMAVEMRL